MRANKVFVKYQNTGIHKTDTDMTLDGRERAKLYHCNIKIRTSTGTHKTDTDMKQCRVEEGGG